MERARPNVPAVCVRRFEGGPRQVLALHCSLAHGGAWAALAEALRPQASLIAPDQPGHGQNPPWAGQGDVFDLATHQAASLLEGPMDVVGHSFGAVLALHLAERTPDKVRSLTLYEPVFFAVARADAPEVMAELDAGIEAFERSLQEGDAEAATRAFVGVWGDGRAWPDLPAAARSYMVERIGFVPATHGVLYDDTHGLLQPEALDQVTMPTLILQGQASPAIISSICAGLAKRLPNAEHEVLAGAGHMGPVSHAAKLGKRLEQFWDRQD